jgi:hypothetical protein
MFNKIDFEIMLHFTSRSKRKPMLSEKLKADDVELTPLTSLRP